MAAEFLAGLDAASGDAGLDAAAVAGAAATAVIVGFVGVQLVRSAPRAPTLAGYRRDGIEQRFERDTVMDVGAGQEEGKRDAVSVGDEVAFCARPAAIRRVRPGGFTPLYGMARPSPPF